MNNNFEKVRCALCGSDSTVPVTSKGQFGIPTHVAICKKCGLMYLNPRWKGERYAHFYSYEYEKYYHRVPATKENEFANIKLIVERIRRDEALPAAPQRILDIGVGFGESLLYLKNNVYQQAEYYAIESSRVCVEFLQSKDIQVISDDVDNDWAASNTGKFDLIIMRHVAEHLLDPVSALKKVASVLSDRGILYLAVPDAYHPVLPLTTYYFRAVHTYYFNSDTITELMQQAGLQVTVLKDDQKGELYLIAKKNPAGAMRNNAKPGYYKQYFIILKALMSEKLQGAKKNLVRRMRSLKKPATGSSK